MDFSTILSIASGLLQVLGYVLYYRACGRNGTTPNSASWFMWALGSAINLSFYVGMTKDDLIKDILPICCAASCIVIFLRFSLKNGLMSFLKELSRKDYTAIAFDMVLVLICVARSASEASLLYQVSTIISFVPMISGIWSGKEKEEPLPWAVWTIAYLVWGISVAMRLNHWQELAYPVTCFVLHGFVAFVARRK